MTVGLFLVLCERGKDRAQLVCAPRTSRSCRRSQCSQLGRQARASHMHACAAWCRLKMMQASTPGPGTATTAARAAGTAAKASATAPRLRRCVSAAALGESDTSSAAEIDGSGAGAAPQTQRGAVVLVLDGTLQPLPWESVPGLRHQR